VAVPAKSNLARVAGKLFWGFCKYHASW